ncbi:hypothetical protein ACFVZL_27850, partial [Streptomyces sp. NPDC058320]|uniref:hypothetical protein n=1 Tax=Streptomyces sp. NPDC058320 TaxID=3346444 RepID=UPI0036E3202F
PLPRPPRGAPQPRHHLRPRPARLPRPDLSLSGALLPPQGSPFELPGVRVLAHVPAPHWRHGGPLPLAPAVPNADTVRLSFAEDAAPAEVYAG